jgi:hypothetical protein
MSTSYATIEEFWANVGQVIDADVKGQREPEVEAFLERVIAMSAYALDDGPTKAANNQTLHRGLAPLMVIALDALRGANAAYVTQSLAGAALCARSVWEATVIFKYIAHSIAPAVYVDRFQRFQMVQRLQKHFRGRLQIEPAEVASLLAQVPEWVDPATGLLKKRPKPTWTADGKSIGDLAKAVGAAKRYEDLYAVASLFSHCSALAANLYRKRGSLSLIAERVNVRGMAILAASCCCDLVVAYAKFFRILMPKPEMDDLATEMLRLGGPPGGWLLVT